MDTPTLIRAALNNAEAVAEAHEHRSATIRIFIDPQVGGLAWDIYDADGYIMSGPIGYDADEYSDDQLSDVMTALEDAGFEVV